MRPISIANDPAATTAGRLSRILEEEPAALALVQLAPSRLEAGEYDEAIELCRNGLVHHPNHSTGHLLYAMALSAAGREEDATRELKEVVHLDPGNRMAIQRLGESYRKAAEAGTVTARPAPHDDIEEEPDLGEEIAFFTNSMAEVYESQGFFEKALAIYQRVLTLQPQRDDVRIKIRNLDGKIGVA